MPGQARILFYDLETAPIIGTLWQKYDTNMVWSIQDWYILCFSYKWLDDNKVRNVAQTDFKEYKPGSPDDRQVINKLHELFDEADIVVAHNGDKFDQKKSNARFIINGLGPASPFQSVDTRKVAKKYFGFTSNKLDDLGEYLGLGKKIKTDKDLWRDCMAGDKHAWKEMIKYCNRDVQLLEQVYQKMLPWDVSHPNRANIEDRPHVCPRCGQEGFIWSQGFRVTKTGKYRRWQCGDCGSYFSDRNQIKGRDKPDYV